MEISNCFNAEYNIIYAIKLFVLPSNLITISIHFRSNYTRTRRVSKLITNFCFNSINDPLTLENIFSSEITFTRFQPCGSSHQNPINKLLNTHEVPYTISDTHTVVKSTLQIADLINNKTDEIIGAKNFR